MVTGTAQISSILANVLQELWQWADNVLPPNFTSEERDCQGPSTGFQCYITLQILGKFYFCVILKIFFLLEFFMKRYIANIR